MCKCTVQSAQCSDSGRTGKQVHNPVNELKLLCTVMGRLPLTNSSVLSVLVAKGQRLSENKVVLLINEDFDPQNSKTLQIGLHGEVEPVRKAEHYSRNCGQHSKYTGGQVMEYRPCIISYRLAGSVKIRPILTGGHLTWVVNFTGVNERKTYSGLRNLRQRRLARYLRWKVGLV